MKRAIAATTGTFSAPILCAFCTALGLDLRALLTDTVVDPKTLEDAEGRIALDVAFRVFDEAPVRANVAHAGLLAAERIPLGSLGFIDLMARAAPTIGEALRRVHRYYILIDDRTTLDLVPEDGVVHVTLRDRADFPAPRAGHEFLLGIIVARWKQLTGVPAPVRALRFALPPPESAAAHQRLFGVEPRFAEPVTEMTLEQSGLCAPVHAADPLVLRYLEQRADHALDLLPRRDDWLDGVRRAVMKALATSEASLESTAKELAMSARSLQRRLQESGTSYQELLDTVRRELAVRWVLDGSRSLEEVTARLAFSDATSFHRAFKRWTGDTPRSYRLRLQH